MTFDAFGSSVRGLMITEFSGSGLHFIGGGNFRVAGNFIDTDETGAQGLGNDGFGIAVEFGTGGVLIGGADPADRNAISGNAVATGTPTGTEVFIDGSDPFSPGGNILQNNNIGVDPAGTAIVGTVSGIRLQTAAGTFIAENVIGGGAGILVEGDSDNTFIDSNYIGVGSNGADDVGARVRH